MPIPGLPTSVLSANTSLTLPTGLGGYGDDPLSDHEDSPSRIQSSLSPAHPNVFSKPGTDGDKLNPHISASSENTTRHSTSSTPSKPAIIIRRHPPAKPHPRARFPDDQPEPGPSSHPQPPASLQSQAISVPPLSDLHDTSDDLTRIRQLLRPPPIPDLQDWGIPPEPTGPCDETIRVKMDKFLALKRGPENPRHFNDSLMSNRAFRNPHLCTKLVEFVDVDERTTNFPKHIWDPTDMKEEWYADRIAEVQKARSEATSALQHSSQRSRIDFTVGSSSSTHRQRVEAGKPGRHQPYNPSNRGGMYRSTGEGVLGSGYGKGRDRSRWG